MHCKKVKHDGTRCGAQALSGHRYCLLHADKNRAVELGRKGGRRRSIFNLEILKRFEPPKTAAEMRELLAVSIIEMREGKLDPKIANALGYLATSFVRVLEISTLESRLAALERDDAPDEMAGTRPELAPHADAEPASPLDRNVTAGDSDEQPEITH